MTNWTASPSKLQHILVIDAPDLRRTIPLEKSIYSIGRHANNSVVIFSQKLSRKHATIVRQKEAENSGVVSYSFRIVDGDLDGNRSKNGIVVNGRKCLEHELKHGDLINFSEDIKASYYIVDYNSDALDLDRLNRQKIINKSSLTFVEKSRREQFKQTQIIANTALGGLQESDRSELVKLASLVELSPNPIIEIDGRGNITYINSAASMKFKTIHQAKLTHPILQGLLSNSQHKNGNLLVREVQIGQEFFEQHIHYLAENQLIRSYIFDVTERRQIEETLQYQASHDPLTDLPNRNLFNEHLSLALANAQRNGTLMAVIFLDLDSFKNINDSLGHSIGDLVLQHFAQRLNGCLRTGDTVARWGGDEFIILLPYINQAEETEKLAQRILDAIRQPFNVGDRQLYIKSSLGIAFYPQDGQDEETLIKNADAALYRAKEQGRSQYQFYSSTLTAKASELLKLEHLLHEALEQRELFLCYQPQIDVTTGKIFGMEALLRWHNRELGLISPGKFIPLAEETGLIVPIGEWVLKTACQHNKAWQKAGIPPLQIAVNLSARQFQQRNLVDLISGVLAQTQLDPQWLELEVTESILMQDVNFARQALQKLKEMGVHISLDDFGTGYSSLSYLKKFPFHTIKIDRSFVRDLQDNPEDTAIIAAVIALGKGLNLKVIAEGVETEAQVELLKRLQCVQMQGYWFSKPIRAEEVAQFITWYSKITN